MENTLSVATIDYNGRSEIGRYLLIPAMLG